MQRKTKRRGKAHFLLLRKKRTEKEKKESISISEEKKTHFAIRIQLFGAASQSERIVPGIELSNEIHKVRTN